MRYEGILKYLRKFTNLLEFYFFGLGGAGGEDTEPLIWAWGRHEVLSCM